MDRFDPKRSKVVVVSRTNIAEIVRNVAPELTVVDRAKFETAARGVLALVESVVRES